MRGSADGVVAEMVSRVHLHEEVARVNSSAKNLLDQITTISASIEPFSSGKNKGFAKKSIPRSIVILLEQILEKVFQCNYKYHKKTSIDVMRR